MTYQKIDSKHYRLYFLVIHGFNGVSKQAKTNHHFVKQSDNENDLWQYEDDDEGKVNG